MKHRDIYYDLFDFCASADNREGWVDAFVTELVVEHERFTGGRDIECFIDREIIQDFAHWHTEIFNKGFVRSWF